MHKKIVLKNGLRIILVPQKSSLAATAVVLVEAGSEYEEKRVNGISHFLEHLCFKGTTNRPDPNAISLEMESLGADYNAYTSQEHTSYHAKVRKDKLPQILDIISDMYLNQVFNPESIEKERGVITEEINMYEDTPSRRIHPLFGELLYGDQPAGWEVAGEKEVIKVLQRDDFVKYRASHYVAPATTVVIAGNFDERKVMRQIEGLFGKLPKAPKGKKAKTREKQSKPELKIKFKESDQSHIALGVRAFDLMDKRRYALEVLSEVLGGGMSSRLFQKIRNEMGAAYSVWAREDLSIDHGAFYITAGLDVKKIEPAVTAILAECTKLTKELVPKEELRKAKDHMLGGMFLGLETSDQLAYYYGTQEILTREILEPETIAKRIEAVTAEEIRRLAKWLFTDKKLNLAVIGPYKEEEPLRKVLKF
jgi:predicted Zn-dependent peptidase